MVFIFILALWFSTCLSAELALLKDHRYITTSTVAVTVVAVLTLFYTTLITLHWVCFEQ